ncbi:MAG: AAA family ATPase, partial [Nitrospinales bacterium]
SILKVYLKPNLPMERKDIDEMISPFLDRLFAKTPQQEVLVLTLRSGELKTLYWKDFISGAIIEGIVTRSKEMAIERSISGGDLKIQVEDLLKSLDSEFKENSFLPVESNMDDWMRLLDMDPRNVVRIKRPSDSDSAAAMTMDRSII